MQAELAAEEITKAGGGDRGKYDVKIKSCSVDFCFGSEFFDFFLLSAAWHGLLTYNIACNYWILAF